MTDSSFLDALFVASSLDVTSFQHTFFKCPVNPHLWHTSLTAGPSFRLIDPFGYVVLPHPLQGLAYCGDEEVLVFWNCRLWSDLCTLDNARGFIVLWRWGVDLSVVSRFTNLLNCWTLLWCYMLASTAIICRPPCHWNCLLADRSLFHLGKQLWTHKIWHENAIELALTHPLSASSSGNFIYALLCANSGLQRVVSSVTGIPPWQSWVYQVLSNQIIACSLRDYVLFSARFE